MALITIDNLSYSYSNDSKALDDVSLSIESGESIALLGENGAGKSTLIAMLLGFSKASSGTIFVSGLPVDNKHIKEIRRQIGLVFQNPDDQLFMPTVYEDIAFGIRNMGLSEEEVTDKAHDAMELTNIEHLKSRAPYNLSTGEKRRAAIAGIIAMEPKILIMDEPSSGLDNRSRRQLIEILKKITSTKLIATHDLAMAKETCSRIIILDKGKKVSDKSASETLSDNELLKTYGFEI